MQQIPVILQWVINANAINILCGIQVHLSRSWVKHEKTWKSRLEADIMCCMLHTVTVEQYIASYDMLLSCQVHRPSKNNLADLFSEREGKTRESDVPLIERNNSENWIKALPPFFSLHFDNSIETYIYIFYIEKTSLLSDCGLLPPSETYSQHSNYRRSIAEQNIFQ